MEDVKYERKVRARTAMKLSKQEVFKGGDAWQQYLYANLFACFFNSQHPSQKLGQYRGHNIRAMRDYRLTGTPFLGS